MEDQDGSCSACDNGLRPCMCNEFTCKDCGAAFSMEHTTRENDGRCFTCWFWNMQYEHRLTCPERSVIVDGTAYLIGEEPEDGKGGWGSGFGGNEFVIKFHDGREVVSHNLWCQGDIADNYADKLPDNAVFTKS